MEKQEIIEKTKSELTEGYADYLEGDYDKDGRHYLLWYVYMDGDVMWIDFEDDSTPGRKIQNAEDFDADILKAVLDSMTGIKEKLILK